MLQKDKMRLEEHNRDRRETKDGQEKNKRESIDRTSTEDTRWT